MWTARGSSAVEGVRGRGDDGGAITASHTQHMNPPPHAPHTPQARGGHGAGTARREEGGRSEEMAEGTLGEGRGRREMEQFSVKERERD